MVKLTLLQLGLVIILGVVQGALLRDWLADKAILRGLDKLEVKNSKQVALRSKRA